MWLELSYFLLLGYSGACRVRNCCGRFGSTVQSCDFIMGVICRMSEG